MRVDCIGIVPVEDAILHFLWAFSRERGHLARIRYTARKLDLEYFDPAQPFVFKGFLPLDARLESSILSRSRYGCGRRVFVHIQPHSSAWLDIRLALVFG
ncbi:MAG: hypothetical protein AUK55_15295 [Syntrophobacteraceae bacterium CG2_30_61_12]|nr:MAG: hypothetical protein AUK55_15295 [Syntrophobacteraceae bacterium CG2_30_61_12]